MVYYNEMDPHAAAWLRELIAAGLIAPGVVDERSIRDVSPDDVVGFTQCHLFAGIGTWSYALRQAGWPDDRPVWTGSCPCQPFSVAGRRLGTSDDRHLWPEMYRLIRECRPDVVFGEQVAGRGGLAWLDLVAADLEDAGYAVGALCAPACGFGAPHIRLRLYWVADAEYAERRAEHQENGETHGRSGPGRPGPTNGFWTRCEMLPCRDGKFRPTEPGAFPLVDGPPGRMVRSGDQGAPADEIDPQNTAEARTMRLRGYGNAIVAPQAEAFIRAYMDSVRSSRLLHHRKEEP